MLIDKRMNKTELAKRVHLSHATIAKMSKNMFVAASVYERICAELECKMKDIVEVLK